MKLAATAIGALITGGILGGYFGGQLGGKGGTVLGLCEMAKVASAQDLLTDAELTQLAEATGRDLQANYPAIGKRLAMSDASKANVSTGSDCSRFLLHMNKGIESAS